MPSYDHLKIEKKWQDRWEEVKVFEAAGGSQDGVKDRYILDMFPYPSGDGLHVGHVEGYTATDIMARYYRMRGENVLHPTGWDAFGLPAENYAIKNKIHPSEAVERNVANFTRQIKSLGFSYDWSREINTTDPEYYKWTQWIFLKLHEQGLAYEEETLVNWDPVDKAVLANEEVIDGKSERSGAKIERKKLRQWILKITEYAEPLLQDLEGLDWPKKIIDMQRNWIGKSTGAHIDFKIKYSSEKLKVFTTRPDTLYGATYMVLAPEHRLVDEITTDLQREAVEGYKEEISGKSDLERAELSKEKTGVFTGAYAVNPVNGEEIPIWIADYVLVTYGTGAIMAVPAHDDRDFEFAKKFDLMIRQVVSKDGLSHELDDAYTEAGQLVNSGEFDGLDSEAAKEGIVKKLAEEGAGEEAVNYKLHDWTFSRQRYWGEPIPMVHCDTCGVVPVPESDLPVLLPDVENYEPTDTGESPLADIEEWVNTECPKCACPAKRETNTMPQWAGSCWYFLRFADPGNSEEAFSKGAMKQWMPVDLYLGGAEHAVLHLLYARFWIKALNTAGYLDFKEPFQKLRNQGLILGNDGFKMSKSRGNVVNPDDVIAEYGADALRLYEMFMGPLEVEKPWDTKGIKGLVRFLQKVWALQDIKMGEEPSGEALQGLLHKTIKKVTKDTQELGFNTAISQMMVLANKASKEEYLATEDFKNFLSLLSPYAPHIVEEIWEQSGFDGFACQAEWPSFEEGLTKEEEVEVAVQVNGKVRAKLVVAPDISEDEIVKQALALPNVQEHLEGKDLKKQIYVPGKILSLVV